jgi:hypothetical protein
MILIQAIAIAFHAAAFADSNQIRSQAEAAFAKLDYGAASKFYHQLLAEQPDACDAHARLAKIEINAGNIVGAAKLLGSVPKRCGQDSLYSEVKSIIDRKFQASSTYPGRMMPVEFESLQGNWVAQYKALNPVDQPDFGVCSEFTNRSACVKKEIEKASLHFNVQLTMLSKYALTASDLDRKKQSLNPSASYLALAENFLLLLERFQRGNLLAFNLTASDPAEENQKRAIIEREAEGYDRNRSSMLETVKMNLDQFRRENPTPGSPFRERLVELDKRYAAEKGARAGI